MVGLFDRVGLNTNVSKIVLMVFCQFQASGMQLEAAYRRRITGTRPSYRERQRGQIQCTEFG